MALTLKKRFPVPHTSRAHAKLPQQTYRKERRRQTAHRTTTTMMALFLLAIGAGLIYTWYIGQQKTALASQPAPVRQTRAIIKPHKMASDAKVGVASQYYTTEVKAGENASITIRTNPEADCTISVKYNNVAAADSGLMPKVADEFGVANWAWTVAASAPTGKWPIEVLCKNKKHSAMVRVDMNVKP